MLGLVIGIGIVIVASVLFFYLAYWAGKHDEEGE